MKFKLGIVGHPDTLEMVSNLVKEYFDDVELYPVEFGNDDIIKDAIHRIADIQTFCDGILFSRRDPYLLISARLQHTVPVRYVEIDKSHLLISLLTAIVRYGIRPTNISIDTFDRTSTLEAFRTVGIPEEHLTIHTVTSDSGQSEMVNDILAQHVERHQNGAELCITNVTDVYRSLLAQNIPATIINPTTESFVHEIRNLMLRSRLKTQRMEQLAYMHIRLLYKEKYRFYGEMPIREIDELSNAAKLITMFADSMDGVVLCLSRWEYMILCNQLLLENATNQFVDIELMENITRGTVFDIVMSIGCGQTIKEARSNAILASHRSLTQRGTNTVVALSSEQIIGPISPKKDQFAEDSVTESRLEEIAGATHLGIGTLNRLYQAIHNRNSSLFTSVELAGTLGVTTRTVNRIIARLLDNRYASIAGKNLVKPKGRPARVIRLLL